LPSLSEAALPRCAQLGGVTTSTNRYYGLRERTERSQVVFAARAANDSASLVQLQEGHYVFTEIVRRTKSEKRRTPAKCGRTDRWWGAPTLNNDGMISTNVTHEHPVCMREARARPREKCRSESREEDQDGSKKDLYLTNPSFHEQRCHEVRWLISDSSWKWRGPIPRQFWSTFPR